MSFCTHPHFNRDAAYWRRLASFCVKRGTAATQAGRAQWSNRWFDAFDIACGMDDVFAS